MISLALFYAALWLVTGFNPIATFRVCLQDQGENLRLFASLGYVPRTWPGTIPGDLYDFDLGAGWIAYLIVGLFFLSAKTQARPWRNIAILCVAQFLLVGLLGLIQCETARVWIFMLPMLMLPLGLELASWNFAWRTTTYAALLVITVAAWQSMTFFPQ
jgi:hypothetical protein